MLTDGRAVSDKVLEADLCIIGAGPAGITIANKLMDTGLRILLIESGGEEADGETENLNNAATVTGEPYPLPGSRLRYLGGTSNHWTGHCYRWIERDFQPRPGVGGSGWPIGLKDILPYYDEAARLALFRSDAFSWDVEHWRKKLDASAWPIDPKLFVTRVSAISPTEANTGLRSFATYIEPLRKSPAVNIVHNANVTEFNTSADCTTVESVQVKTLSGRAFSVTAKRFILATGGFENARILLASNRGRPAGLGNEYDQVGRYFADHIVITQKFVRNPDLPHDDLMDFQRHDNRTHTTAHLYLSDEVVFREQLDNVFVRVMKRPETIAPGVRAAQRVKDSIASDWSAIDGADLSAVIGDLPAVADWAGERAYCRPEQTIYDAITRIEPTPNPDSRITLSSARDKLGVPVANLHWAVSDRARYSARRTLDLFAGMVGASNMGRLQITFDPEKPWPQPYDVGYHHTCTTRMGDDPKTAVVDRNLRVFGIDNLYVIGSSVFRSAGSGSPTMMITALSLRLADHLKEAA